MSKNLPGSGGGGGHSVPWNGQEPVRNRRRRGRSTFCKSGMNKNLPTNWRRGRRRRLCAL